MAEQCSPGVPSPEAITLSDVKDNTNLDCFDPTRLTGGEYYQGRMVRIKDVHFAGGTWGPDQTMTLADDTGRSLPLLLGHSTAFCAVLLPGREVRRRRDLRPG